MILYECFDQFVFVGISVAIALPNLFDSKKTNMKKNYLVLALLAVTTLVRANTCTVINPCTINNTTTTVNLTTTLAGVIGNSVTACSFNFNNCSLTSFGGGLLYCNIGGTTIGTLTKNSSSWSCDITSSGLTTLNNCINAGSACSFGITCTGGWSIGGCTATYTCTPTPHSVPDASSTASLLGLGLTGAALLRRKLA